jgi:hypothetical protein
VHVDDIRAQPLASDLEAQQRARRIFEEGVDDGEAGQRIVMFVPLAVQIDPLFRLVEQEQDFMPFELRDAGRRADPPGSGRWRRRFRAMPLKPSP